MAGFVVRGFSRNSSSCARRPPRWPISVCPAHSPIQRLDSLTPAVPCGANDDWDTPSPASGLADGLRARLRFGLRAASRCRGPVSIEPALIRRRARRPDGTGASCSWMSTISRPTDAQLLTFRRGSFPQRAQAAKVGLALSVAAPRPVLVRAAGPALAVRRRRHAAQSRLVSRIRNAPWAKTPAVHVAARPGNPAPRRAWARWFAGAVATARRSSRHPASTTALVDDTGGASGHTLV